MIGDSLAKYTRGESLASHACIANLLYKLGFADANIIGEERYDIRGSDTTRASRMVLFVREPQDSALVHPLVRVVDDTPRLAEWHVLTEVFRADPSLFYSFYRSYLEGGVNPPPARDSIARAHMLDVLAKEHTDGGYAKALRVLEKSPSNPDRSVAILVLSRYPERDEAWRALLTAAVDDNQWLDTGIAQEALEMLSRRYPRRVDWAPVVPVIRNVLDGTALPALMPVIHALLGTAVDKQSASALLNRGGEMLTAVLEVSLNDVSGPAHELLVKLRGADLGKAPAPWREWIGTLP
jgi:hypothetical protein